MSDSTPAAAPTPPRRKTILDFVEWLGNKLPEPALIFAILAAIVVIVSAVGASLGWRVQPVRLQAVKVQAVDPQNQPIFNEDGSPKLINKLKPNGRPETRLEPTGNPIQPRSLLTADGVYWMLSSMLRNFTTLPALGLIFVAMLGIGVAEKVGLFGAFMRLLAMATPKRFLTPMVVFIGANSSVASDAGYVILPPLAAALYLAVGRHPIAGLAAAFCGVSGGFGGGFFPTGGDGFLAGTASQAAHIIDAKYHTVLITHNLYFKMGSAIVVTLAGWFVTDRIIEPRLLREIGKPGDVKIESKSLSELALSRAEKRGLLAAGLTHLAVVAAFAVMILAPGMPLNGRGLPTLANGQVLARQSVEVFDDVKLAVDKGITPEQTLVKEPLIVAATGKPSLVERPEHRWSQVIVPLIFFASILPGIAFGIVTGAIRNQQDFIQAFYHGIRGIVPVLGIMFFLGQFVNYFEYTKLDRMLAYAGGSALVNADLPIPLLIVLFVLLVICGDFAISGMLSKFAILAPIFIPMFMMVGISPELTTAAYRIGDSVVNIITPLNSYLLIILAVLQKYKPSAGLGTQISLMLPFSVVLCVAWTAFLLLWYALGIDLGPGSPLTYSPSE